MIGSKMAESSTVNPKVNTLMGLFLKRQATQPLPAPKPAKKIKPNQDKANDPLYQILSWRDDIRPSSCPPEGSYRTLSQPSIVEAQPERWGTNLQGIFINVDWSTTSMQSFKRLALSNEVLSNGMVFVWGTKTNIGELLDHFDSMGYVYAENFTFVLLDRSKIPEKSQKQLPGNASLLNYFSKGAPKENLNNANKPKIAEHQKSDYQIGRVSDPASIFLDNPSEYFSGSQRILYMFRKINKKQALQLRHQRTSDVYFTIGENDALDWRAKEIVYRMIETLLINANYRQGHGLKLLQLWASHQYARKGWVMVSEQGVPKRESVSSCEGLEN